MRDGYTSIVARLLWLTAALLGAGLIQGQTQPGKLKDRKKQEQIEQQQKEQEPPEEDVGSTEKEYSFNPLQAQRELRTGNFYYKKGNYKAASRRFQEATKWDPSSAEAFLRLGQSQEKLKDQKAAHDAYAKYLDLAPDSKEAEVIRKKLQRHR
jgi:tetratricopeptide (TPR) repeat protein